MLQQQHQQQQSEYFTLEKIHLCCGNVFDLLQFPLCTLPIFHKNYYKNFKLT